ncbi:DUF4189 domain-containing protein [uncultured Shimia sp.]|uniref:DUF4189 domain-containing protein n=1 Tax=uncultured Shimia sp. TaxID=573152 RepID=UPI0025CF14C1|nr:DUF4189 domain-containing protein [uncultured Shimia sp.]
MTAKQAAAYEEQKSQKGTKAFAISPDGAWGYTYGKNSAKDAQAQALAYCREHMRKKQRDCMVYSLNGKRVAPAVVQTKKVTTIYKPLKAKDAAKVFGFAPGTFTGNKAAAKAEYNALKKGAVTKATLPRDAALEALLTNRSLMTKGNSPFLLWFQKSGGEQHGKGRGGALLSHFDSWRATPNGLMCMFDSYWDSGKAMGTRCLYIDSLKNGEARVAWIHISGGQQKAQLLQGDARYAAVR